MRRRVKLTLFASLACSLSSQTSSCLQRIACSRYQQSSSRSALEALCVGSNVSDWKPGSQWQHQRQDDARTVDMVGKVVESNPPRRLIITWARPKDAEEDSKHSRVTFDIEPQAEGLVRLTVTHEDLEGDPEMFKGIAGGWPKILSNLKTLLETGRALTPTLDAHRD